jgi:hypothetical protein
MDLDIALGDLRGLFPGFQVCAFLSFVFLTVLFQLHAAATKLLKLLFAGAASHSEHG